MATHSIIRHFKPGRVIEIGSGMSSRVIAGAAAMVRAETGLPCEYTVVDPYPCEVVANGMLAVAALIRERVEVLPLAFFDVLGANDILFIDSGHCVRIGGDVNALFLEVLPRLKPGVIVHVHDIAMPYEYPKVYATSETFRQFWTEQYLLQSFLCYNSEFEILLAMGYLQRDHADVFDKAFPYGHPAVRAVTSGSFWMRRKLRTERQVM